MKKFFIPALAVTALFGLSSCSNENEPIAVSGDGVTFAVGLPGSLNTRGSFGDGTGTGDRVTINNLHYTVFEKTAEGYKYVLDSTVDNPFASGDTQLVTIALAKGKTYNVVFYADDSTNNFATYAPQTGVMSVDYSNAASNVEGEDAFTGASGDLEVSATPSKTVTLYRPYAQLNWGTDDINDPILAGFIDSLEGSVKITSGLATSYSLLTGEYDGAPSGDVEFDAVNVKNSLTQTFPVVHADPSKSYSLIAMNYLLTGEGTIDCSLNFTEGLSPVEVNSAPVKPNYRTNIYGSLLTSPTEFNVEISRPFYGDNNIEIVPVYSADDFMSVIAAGNTPYVPAGTEIDLVGKDDIELADNQVLIVDGTIKADSQQISVSGEGVTAFVEGDGTLAVEGLTDDSGKDVSNYVLTVKDNATLNVKGVTITATQNDGGATVQSVKGNLIMEDVKVQDVSHIAVEAQGGTFTAKNCVFDSDSNNQEGAYSYTVKIWQGAQATLDGCTVNGIQGGVAVGSAGTSVTINGGTYETVPFNGQVWTAFYPVYVYDNAIVTINGGNFICGNPNGYAVYNSNNDVPEEYTWGNGAIIRGGNFSARAYDAKDKTLIPAAEGYEWVDNGDDATYKWSVKAVNP